MAAGGHSSTASGTSPARQAQRNCHTALGSAPRTLSVFLVIAIIKQYKERQTSKRAISKIMFDCLLDCGMISVVLEN
jgi:hypothetical protein